MISVYYIKINIGNKLDVEFLVPIFVFKYKTEYEKAVRKTTPLFNLSNLSKI